jgi:hypothetical protein
MGVRKAIFALVGLMLLAAWPAHALDFSLQTVRTGNCGDRCPQVIVATGDIYIDDDRRLLNLFKSAGDTSRIARVLMINSPGGQAGGGFKLAFIARYLKLAVMVASPRDEFSYGPAYCASACTLVLSGGVKRIVMPGSVVAIHWSKEPPPIFDPATSNFLERPKVSDDQLAAEFRRFFKTMGVNGKIVDLMRKTPNSEGLVLTPKQLRSLRLATSSKL